jgi:hypothetical protein
VESLGRPPPACRARRDRRTARRGSPSIHGVFVATVPKSGARTAKRQAVVGTDPLGAYLCVPSRTAATELACVTGRRRRSNSEVTIDRDRQPITRKAPGPGTTSARGSVAVEHRTAPLAYREVAQ